jgi:2'-hydroxyisoflavone reductase
MYLIIGGTKFLGRHLVDSLLGRGHEVALFNRGKYSAERVPNVETINGDRNRDLEKLNGRKWEAVIDTCGYLPETVRKSAEFFSESTEAYVFVSSMSCYDDTSRPDYDETTPVSVLTPEQRVETEKIDPSSDITAASLGEYYGPLKALCEEAAEAAMPGRVLNVRSGMIVGPYDPTDRFTYWVMRVARGGEVLAPGRPEGCVQMIDARDLSNWIISMAEKRAAGTFNVTGRPFEMNFGSMLEQINEAVGGNARFTWADEEFLDREGVQPWSEMPFFLPRSLESTRGFLAANIDKALESGLTFRSFAETVLDTWTWRNELGAPLKAGITAEREAELLAKLKDR